MKDEYIVRLDEIIRKYIIPTGNIPISREDMIEILMTEWELNHRND